MPQGINISKYMFAYNEPGAQFSVQNCLNFDTNCLISMIMNLGEDDASLV